MAAVADTASLALGLGFGPCKTQLEIVDGVAWHVVLNAKNLENFGEVEAGAKVRGCDTAHFKGCGWHEVLTVNTAPSVDTEPQVHFGVRVAYATYFPGVAAVTK